MTDKPSPTAAKNETVARAMQILSLFQEHGELGLREIARLLGLSTSVTYRMTDTMRSYRFLRQLPETKRYVLGPAALEIAQRFREEDRFTQICTSIMDELRDRTHETIALYVYRDGMRTNVLESRSPHPLRHVMRPGVAMPLTHGATDIIMRALTGPVEQKRIAVQLKKSGDPGRLPTDEEFELFRERGWSTSLGARTPGGAAIAAPVVHPEALYVLALVGPRDRVLDAGLEQLAKFVLTAASEMRDATVNLHASL